MLLAVALLATAAVWWMKRRAARRARVQIKGAEVALLSAEERAAMAQQQVEDLLKPVSCFSGRYDVLNEEIGPVHCMYPMSMMCKVISAHSLDRQRPPLSCVPAGRGSFGIIYKGIDMEAGITLAVKVVSIGASAQAEEDVLREIGLLETLSHRCSMAMLFLHIVCLARSRYVAIPSTSIS